ncbi:hypothetical protein THRCLA_22673, partial [Thraustotheca clavata]
MDKYVHKQPIAPALYGEIFMATSIVSNNLVVIKKMQMERAHNHESIDGFKVHEDILMEKVVYQMIRAVGGHKNIIQLYD